MLNKKVLSKIDLGSYTKPNPFHKDIIYDPRGQWDHPGQNTRIPGEDITMQGVPYPVYAQPNVGQPQMMYPDQNYQFPGADYVDEFPQMKKGGRTKGLISMPKPSKKGLMSNKYSRSLDATNKLFTENYLFAKPKSRKNKVFDPNANYAKGGALLTKEVTCKKCGWEWDAADGGKDITTCHKCGGQGLVHAQDGGNKDAMTGMMKARLAYANEFGNPAAKRMINLPDNPYQFDNGDTGSHYMASYDNYAVPQIQDENGVLQLGDYGPESNEAIRFDSDEDANYFAENYKDVSPGFIEADLDEDEIEEYRRGGYVVEDISIPSLNQMQDGGTYTVKGSDGVYKKVNGKWQVDWNRSGKYQPLSKGDVKARTAVLDKMAKPLYDKDYDEMVAYKNLSAEDKINKFEPKKELTKEELKKVSERLGRDYKPEDTKLQSVDMVYPEKYLIGPGGGLLNQGLKTGVGAIEKLAATKIPRLFGTTVGQAAGAGFAADALVNQFPGAISDIGKGEYEDAAEKALYGTLGLAGSGIGKGVVSGAKDLSKFLGTDSGVLSNTYKINPWAFKPNPEAYYRGIGEAGYKDAIESGVLRTNRNPNWTSSPGDSPYFFNGKNFKGIKQYEPNVIAEVTNQPMRARTFSRLAEKGDESVFQPIINTGQKFAGMDVVKKLPNIPLGENIKFYKKHWRKGYKEIPKQLPGSPNTIFSKYLTPKEAVIARAERMLVQEPKWQVNSNNYTKDKFTNVNNNFEEIYANEIGKSPQVLGTNMLGKAFVFKDNGLSSANQARIAAHEIGHFYRNAAKEADEWNSFFDFSKLKSSTRKYLRGKRPTAMPYNNGKTEVIETNLNNNVNLNNNINVDKSTKGAVYHGDEIRERAAQLKDYIAQKNGIPLNQDFEITQVQLDDAIKNYVKDTGLDNTMSAMLGALKNKKGFLKAMNKYALGTVPVMIGAETLQQKKQGGATNDYVDVDLTPEEIKDLIAQGYVIEELN